MSDNLSRLLDLANKLAKDVPLAGMLNPDATTCRYAAIELEDARQRIRELEAELAEAHRRTEDHRESSRTFSAQCIAQEKHIKELEALVLAAMVPQGNYLEARIAELEAALWGMICPTCECYLDKAPDTCSNACHLIKLPEGTDSTALETEVKRD